MLKYFQKSKQEHGSSEDKTESKQEADRSEDAVTSCEINESPTSPKHDVQKAQMGRPASASKDQSEPVISDEDELFLLHVASEGEPPPLPPRPSAEQHRALTSPTDDAKLDDIQQETEKSAEASDESERPSSKDTKSWQNNFKDFFSKPQADHALQRFRSMAESRQASNLHRQRSKDRQQTADTLSQAATAIKNRSSSPSPTRTPTASDPEAEAKAEQKEVTNILSSLNLSTLNNRAVGISNDTQKLLERFNQVLKDIVNGVPTAYDDLEKLLTERQGQLDKLYGTLPPWLQGLVKTIPVKVYAAMAPQLAAAVAAGEGAESQGKDEGRKGKKKKSKFRIPTVKDLVGQKGMVAGMLRSIISFLSARFPLLLTGTNVIVSIAVFVLLFVFWYCHKRGKETRLAREAEDTEEGLEESDGVDADSLSDLEKGVDVEKSRALDDEEDEPKMQALPAVDDKDIEQNVDTLMAQLGKPHEEAAASVR